MLIERSRSIPDAHAAWVSIKSFWTDMNGHFTSLHSHILVQTSSDSLLSASNFPRLWHRFFHHINEHRWCEMRVKSLAPRHWRLVGLVVVGSKRRAPVNNTKKAHNFPHFQLYIFHEGDEIAEAARSCECGRCGAERKSGWEWVDLIYHRPFR